MTLKKFISQACWKLFLPVRSVSHDHPIYDPEKMSVFEHIFKSTITTLRYRFASIRIPLTSNEGKLLAYRNRHKGKRCFIIGNGPSLNKLDLEKLRDEVSFGVNAIYTNYNRMGFYPTYYVVEDTFVAEDRASEINNYKESTKFFGNFLTYCLKKDNRTILLNVIMKFEEYPGFPHFSTNAARCVWVAGTVTYLCMQLAYYMGFSEVYLIGFDHSYAIPNGALIDGTNITSTSDDPNHFSPDYFGKGKRWHDPKVDRMEKAYRKAKMYFEADGRRIYNATVGGKLEVFDRIDYASLFNKKD